MKQKTTKIHHHVSRAAGFPHAKRSSSVTNPTVTSDHVFWVNLTFFLWKNQEIHSPAQSLSHPFTHSLARVEKRTGEYVWPSELGRVCCAAGIVTRTSPAIVELTPNKSATTKVELVYWSSAPLRLQHSYCIVSVLLATALWALRSSVDAWTVLTVPC
jgi:hypothetical protein